MNNSDTAWVLVATALVLLMTPALAFVYGGLVRKKNALRRYIPNGFCVRLDEAPEEYFRLLANLFRLRFRKEQPDSGKKVSSAAG